MSEIKESILHDDKDIEKEKNRRKEQIGECGCI